MSVPVTVESTPPGHPVEFETRRIVYNDSIARWFVAASVIWGIVGMLVGAIIALQLAFWQANCPPTSRTAACDRCIRTR